MNENHDQFVTMGIIANEVYNNTQNKDYFQDNPDDVIVNDSTYKVIEHTGDYTLTGFNAFLLEEINGTNSNGTPAGTGNYVIAFRGTEPLSAVDWVTNFQTGVDNYSPQFNEALAFVQNILKTKDKGYDVSTSNLTLTGHSLGGILTQAVGATLKIQGYAYNPWGSDVLATLGPDNIYDQLLQYLQRSISGAQAPGADINWAKDNIYTISYQDHGLLNGDILSNLLTGLISEHLGTFIPIWGADRDLLGGHDIKNLIPAIEHANAILSRFTANTTYQDLSAAYVSMNNYHEAEFIFSDLGVYKMPKGSNLTFDFLVNKTATQLETRDKATFYALYNLNPFAIKGNLPAYANLHPDDFGDRYLKQRSWYLYHTLHKEAYDSTTGLDYYEDRRLGSAYTLDNGTWNHKVIFGSEGDTYNSYEVICKAVNNFIAPLHVIQEKVVNEKNNLNLFLTRSFNKRKKEVKTWVL